MSQWLGLVCCLAADDDDDGRARESRRGREVALTLVRATERSEKRERRRKSVECLLIERTTPFGPALTTTTTTGLISLSPTQRNLLLTWID